MWRDLLSSFFHPPIRLFQFATGFWVSQVLFAAVELEVFTSLATRPLTAEEFSHHSGLKRRPAEALLIALVSLGLLGKRGDRYKNSRLAARWLVKGFPEYLGDGLLMLSQRLYRPWGHLLEALREDRPTSYPPQEDHLFSFLAQNPAEARLFTRAMHALSLLPARALARRYDFSRHKRLADLGGGSGVYCIEAVRRFPLLQANLVEGRAAVEVARDLIGAAGLEDRIEVHEGDLFHDSLPEGTDVVLLSHVVHDFSLEESRLLIGHLYQQLPANGVLLLSEWLLGKDLQGPLAAALMGVNMVVDTPTGRSYAEGEIRDLLRTGGFRRIRIRSLYGPARLVVAEK